MDNVCNICTLKYSQKRKRTICSECNFQCCNACLLRYLSEKKDTEKKCMNPSCSFVLCYISIHDVLGKRTTNKLYKDILVMNETCKYTKLKNSMELKKQKSKLVNEWVSLSRQVHLMEKVYDIQMKTNSIDSVFFEMIMSYYDAMENIDTRIERLEIEQKVEKCSNPVCDGYLFPNSSDSNSCTTCRKRVCKKCTVMIEEDDSHLCDENIVKNVEEIRKNTKQCPVCENSIFKIEGCRQMFCTLCNTKFDWVSGEIYDKSQEYHNNYFVNEVNSHKKKTFMEDVVSFEKKIVEKNPEFEIMSKIIYRLGYEVLPLYKQKLLDSKNSFEKRRLFKIEVMKSPTFEESYKKFLLKSHINIKILEKDCKDFTKLFKILTNLMEKHIQEDNKLVVLQMAEHIEAFVVESDKLFWKRNEVFMYTRTMTNIKKWITS